MTQASSPIPRLTGYDHTIAFLREGYPFISRRCEALGSTRFAARLMLRPVICARGTSAAHLLYGGRLFTRQGALPPTVLRLLQDKGSVQQLDGEAHRHRKALFMELLLNDDGVAEFLALFREEWFAALEAWTQRSSISVFDEATLVLTRAICRWVGVSLAGRGAERMTADLVAMFDSAGKTSPAVLAALLRRNSAERFVSRQVEAARVGTRTTPLGRVARYRNLDGSLLTTTEATVEVINLLRPTVAIGQYIMFVALALHEHPDWKRALHGADDARYDSFAEEVRRYYPFFPVVGGVAREAFDWDGHWVKAGAWIMLDLYGTNRDPQLFPEPQRFDPERELSWKAQGYDFIPQGAGDIATSHRCPGEQFTLGVMREAARMMVENMEYSVPAQDLSLPLNRIPTRPRSKMVIADISRAGAGVSRDTRR